MIADFAATGERDYRLVAGESAREARCADGRDRPHVREQLSPGEDSRNAAYRGDGLEMRSNAGVFARRAVASRLEICL
jgi:hypothetical protein